MGSVEQSLPEARVPGEEAAPTPKMGVMNDSTAEGVPNADVGDQDPPLESKDVEESPTKRVRTDACQRKLCRV